jgi:hypothetical protein
MASVLTSYQIQDQIDTGSFGSVFRGLNPETGEQVAIKVATCENAGLNLEAKVLKILTN